MGACCINRSSSAIQVYSTSALTNVVGSINVDCCFLWISRWPGSDAYYPSTLEEVYFLNSQGGIQHGYMLNSGSGETTSLLNYSFGGVTAAGTSYKSLKTRYALTRYDSAGTNKGTVPAGARILTNDTQPGSSNMCTCMKAMFAETGVGTGQYVYVSGTAGSYGYVDFGLSNGSQESTVGIYGNW